MDGPEYLARKRQLAQFEALQKNAAFVEFSAEMQREFGACVAGLRNKKLPLEELRGFQEGADVVERLARYVTQRIDTLRAETSLTEDEIKALKLESEAD